MVTLLLRALKYISFTCSGLSTFFLIFNFKQNKTLKISAKDLGLKNSKGIAIALLSVSVLSFPVFFGAAQQIIGFHNLYFESDGTYCYLVESNGDKYPAQISIESETEDNGETRTTSYHFFLEKIILNNGKEVNFYSEPLKVNTPTSVTSEDGDIWSVTLLNEHGYSVAVDETDKSSTVRVLLCILLELPMLYLLLVLVAPEKEND